MVDQKLELKSFALQHQGKNLFDQKRYDEALKHFYDAMMIRVQLKRHDLAVSSRLVLDTVVNILFPPPTQDRQNEILARVQTPDFVRAVSGKKHSEIAQTDRPSCINAVYTFFDRSPYKYETAQTSAVLEFLKKECEQIAEPLKKEIVFHKPSPNFDVPYKLDYFESAAGALKYAKGFETTWHLKRSS